jgi:hypothetical protein
VVLRELNQAGSDLLRRLFDKKTEWETKSGQEFFLWAELDLRYRHRTYKQNSTVWKLIEAIWMSMEKNPPTEDEKYNLYLDLLEVYADKVKNRVNGELRPVHISEANSFEGARFIDGLLYHLATACDLDYNAQSTVLDVLCEWEAWRGGLELDPLDYRDLDCREPLTGDAWRKKHPYSEASGRGGDIVRAHIVSRGSDAADIEKSWNWIALLWEEHERQHQIGWEAFVRIYPHLRGRVERARRLAGKPALGYTSSQGAVENKPERLAEEALEEL